MDLINVLSEICHSTSQPIIAIDGPAGAGKTTLAQTISLALSPRMSTTVIHMDDLYNGWDFALDENLTKTLVWLARSHKDEKPLKYSSFNWVLGSFDAGKEIPSSQLLILEGVGSSQRSVEELITTSIWLDLDPQIGYQRVLDRDGENIANSMTLWLATQEQHFRVEDTKERCEFVLST
jgi:uridine kinase